MKMLFFYFIFVLLVFFSWFIIGVITVLMGELIGIRPGRVILGILAIISAKWAWGFSYKLINKNKEG